MRSGRHGRSDLSHHFSDKPFPRLALVGAAALLGFAMLAAAGSRLTDIGTTELPPAEPAASRDLHFEDLPDGSLVVVTAAAERQLVDMLAPGGGGFVRGVLRGLNRDRKLRGIGPEEPYRLTRWRDGRLSLSDSATGMRIDLEPFGPTNIEAFARMLRSEPRAMPAGVQARRQP